MFFTGNKHFFHSIHRSDRGHISAGNGFPVYLQHQVKVEVRGEQPRGSNDSLCKGPPSLKGFPKRAKVRKPIKMMHILGWRSLVQRIGFIQNTSAVG